MLTDVFLYFYHLSAWYCIDIVRRNCLGHSLELKSYRLLILICFKAKGKLSTVADQKKNYKVKLSNTILSPDYNQTLNRKLLLNDRTICKLWQKYHQFWLVEGSIHILNHYLELMLHIREKWGGGGAKDFKSGVPIYFHGPHWWTNLLWVTLSDNTFTTSVLRW